jgi:hypothetical protein
MIKVLEGMSVRSEKYELQCRCAELSGAQFPHRKNTKHVYSKWYTGIV